MEHIVLLVLRWLLVGSAFACGIAVVCWFLASTYGTSPRRGKTFLTAHVLAGSGICLVALTFLLFNHNLPIIQTEGNIESVQIHPKGRDFRSDLLIRTASGGVVAIHASGRSPYFRPGEHVKVQYQGYTGTILKVYFFSADGGEEGGFNGTDRWPPYFALLGGLTLIWYGFRKYHRDPEGAEEPSHRNPKPYGGVDKDSLLRLPRPPFRLRR